MTPTPAASSPAIATITERDVQQSTDSGSFSRGSAYFRQGRIHDTVLREHTLTALCDGSDYQPYRIEVTLGRKGNPAGAIIGYECSCPRGGFCKHIVATLLAWIDDPGRFVALPPLAESLANLGHDDLVRLVVQMIRRHPDLERMVELVPAPSIAGPGGSANVATQDPATIRRHARAAMENYTSYNDGWGHMPAVSPEMENLVELGRSHIAAGRWADAQVVFTSLAEEITAVLLDVQDDEGELSAVLASCDEGLAAILAAQVALPEGDRLDDAQREELIRAGYDLWSFDSFDAGGIADIGAAIESIATHATPAERAMVESWLDAEKPDSDWTRTSLVHVRVMLREAAGVSDEELLSLYRDAELWDSTAALLLEHDRVEEAIATARKHLRGASPFLAFATALAAHGSGGARTAISMVEDRAWEVEKREPHADVQYQAWLIDMYRKQGKPEDALRLAEKRFRQHPGIHLWNELRDIATAPGISPATWVQVRQRLLDQLRATKVWSVLIEIFLDEHDAAAALDAWDQSRKMKPQPGMYAPGWNSWDLATRLAEVAEQEFPDRAIAIYRTQADALIAQRSRDRYKVAAGFLARVKRILERDDRGDDWSALIAEVRTANKTLRALKEELDTLGL